jgi:hypothetical protein
MSEQFSGTNEDKRKAVAKLLGDPEWKDWSNAEIARHCGVSTSFVASVRNKETEVPNE